MEERRLEKGRLEEEGKTKESRVSSCCCGLYLVFSSSTSSMCSEYFWRISFTEMLLGKRTSYKK